jgi:hypothetical protein
MRWVTAFFASIPSNMLMMRITLSDNFVMMFLLLRLLPLNLTSHFGQIKKPQPIGYGVIPAYIVGHTSICHKSNPPGREILARPEIIRIGPSRKIFKNLFSLCV